MKNVITPKRYLGQNFLQHQGIIFEILNACNFHHEDKVVEIGPGLGALTVYLLKYLSKIIAIEIDADLQTTLNSLPNASEKLELLTQDALTVDFAQWGSEIRIIGNLPYNISTPLLFHLLKFVVYIKDMHFMLQKEVVDRITAAPGSKHYGRLSIMLQISCAVDDILDVPPQAFTPQPKVQSKVIRLRPYTISPYSAVNQTTLSNIVRKAFAMRRKTIINNLKCILNIKDLRAIKINPNARPEQIAIEDYVKIANYIDNLGDTLVSAL
ncbi:MAG: 16S rRNA (adenine(1518)-N(6)/adenine(1519)-N(6))-dimethyltransferase [Legionellales bacterium RIFCSPHIGHO2_12_FULL_42_9]|nr:MAG: 16S rRNA (adenine(1518)-N(6)/adenine(1519)-N(6))-dimethyltransferase [Legionellales bacterium RIFCSPHIGHO2_12_FULL_42_9]